MRSDGRLRLARRAVCFDPRCSTSGDCMVRVDVGGDLLFEDKVKPQEARVLGFQRGPDDLYFVDALMIPARGVEAPSGGA